MDATPSRGRSARVEQCANTFKRYRCRRLPNFRDVGNTSADESSNPLPSTHDAPPQRKTSLNNSSLSRNLDARDGSNENQPSPLVYSESSVKRRTSQKDYLIACDIDAVPHSSFRLTAPTFCQYCGAKKFQYESPGFCCANGQVKIPTPATHPDLTELFGGRDVDARNFRTYARLYNNMFAFTSFGGDFSCISSQGIYTFKAHGQIYHYLPSLLPPDGNPKYMQLYFYDAEHELENRTKPFKEVQTSVIAKLMKIMDINPYAVFFKSLKEVTIDEHTTIQISKNPMLDQRVYNTPSSSEVAAILLDSTTSSESSGPYIVVNGQDSTSHRIMHHYGCYDPLQYPLLFPHGQPGWRQGIPRCKPGQGHEQSIIVNPVITADNTETLLHEEAELATGDGTTRARHVSCREYYCYLMQIRPGNYLVDAERLFQQFVVDMYVKLENTQLDFYRNNQGNLRAELYQGIIDTTGIGEENAANVGRRIILPPTFVGGPRDMKRRYLNAMALVQKYGKPDLFLTMTCNPNWPEIKDELAPGQQSHNRPDLLARIFRARLIHLKKLIVEKHVFGEVAAYIYVVEFQKRGLPHAHFLIILKKEDKIRSPDEFDRYVCTELPPPTNPYLRKLVISHMLHGPCGLLNPQCGCMRDIDGQRKCRFKYPKEFNPYTTANNDGYPLYRRRNNGDTVTIREVDLDNRWVIPYNAYLLALFDSHINVEICSTVEAVKYLYKYVYKGHDKVAFNVTRDGSERICDEITNFQSGRWVSPPEAAWRIFGFSLFEMHPPVLPLQVHLPNMQSISFRPNEQLSTIISNDHRSKTALTEFFKMNTVSNEARRYLYSEFPEHFTWNNRSKVWKRREQNKIMVGRLAFVNPSESERFYLRLLLTDVRGPTSFEDLLTVNGQLYSTFHEAAIAQELVEQSTAVENCMDEAVALQMPAALRRLFVTLLVFCNPPNPSILWDKYKGYLSEDIRHHSNLSDSAILTSTIRKIEYILDGLGKTLTQVGLGHLHQDQQKEERIIQDIQDVLEAPIAEEYIQARKQLNTQQKMAYKRIIQCIKTDAPGCFFIDGPGGTGKTFLYNALYAKVRQLNKIVLPTASSGIAASNLPCGRTTHSRFKLPIDLESSTVCNVPKQGALAGLIKRTSLIIWDEAPMAHNASVHSLDSLLRDLCDCDLPFGGKVVVLGGDYRQVLPVLPRRAQQESVEASLVSSHLWLLFTRFYLTVNMRARTDPAFANFLLNLGDGKLQNEEVGNISLPSHMLIPFSENTDPLDTLVADIFPEFLAPNFNSLIFIERAVLAPRNDEVDMINEALIARFPGEVITFKGIDKLLDDSCNIYPVEFLHTLAPSGMAPYELKLKKNSPVMLLRNLDPSSGLCNGTRLICRKFLRKVIVCEIATGFTKGQLTVLHQIHLRPPAGSQSPFQFQRTQFPIKLSFAMTINKAQGQTLDSVGIYLRQPCFSHGQLYVALSRARHSSKVKVFYVEDGSVVLTQKVRNVVSFEILRRAGII